MFKNLKSRILKNFEIFGLILLILFVTVFTSFFNYKKKINLETYNDFIDNIYFQKTLREIINNLEPKYQKINHKVKSGETFDKILENYSIQKKEIIKIKSSLQKKVNLNKLNTRQVIQFSLDKTNNKIEEFTFQISNTEKIYLKRDFAEDSFE